MISLTGTNFGSTITAQGSSGALAVTIAGKLCGSLSMVTANTLIKCQLVPPLALESCLDTLLCRSLLELVTTCQ